VATVLKIFLRIDWPYFVHVGRWIPTGHSLFPTAHFVS